MQIGTDPSIIQFYLEGYNTLQVMKLVHKGYHYVKKVLIDAGVYRTQSEAALDRYQKVYQKIPQNDIIDLYQQGLSIDLVSHKLDIPYHIVRRCLIRNKVIRSIHETGLIKSSFKQGAHFFDIIDTEEKAYWLGLLYADGRPQRFSIGLNLKREDKDHVIKFASLFGYKTFDYNSNGFPATGCDISNVYLVDQLQKKGILVGRPSPHLPFDHISQSLLRHFIRGFSDGDGCLTPRIYYNYFTKREKKYPSISLCNASHTFLEIIRSIIVSQLGISQNEIIKRNNIWVLSCIGNRTDEIFNWLYEPSIISLPRKYRQYQEIYL